VETDRSVLILVKADLMNLKETIVHESLKLFSLKGFVSTSIIDIISVANTSKGGFYNHFSSKEELFYQVLDEARNIWRERNLYSLDEVNEPIRKIKKLLENYRDRYLVDTENFPGGCIFIIFSVELGNQRPHLAQEVHKGFIGLKAMLQRLLDESKELGELHNGINTSAVTEILFNGMLGVSVSYSADKSFERLNKSIDSLIDFIENLKQ